MKFFFHFRNNVNHFAFNKKFIKKKTVSLFLALLQTNPIKFFIEI